MIELFKCSGYSIIGFMINNNRILIETEESRGKHEENYYNAIGFDDLC